MIENATKIVIIDDETDLCFLLSMMLKSYGYQVTYFHTLETGLDAIIKESPNWVILDNNLPDGLGWDKVNDILDMDDRINIIKISANPDSNTSQKLANLFYLVKPIDVESIVALIDQYSTPHPH